MENVLLSNIEAEIAVLGAILLDPEAIERVVDILVPEAFFVSSHRRVYEAVLELHKAGNPIDLVIVTGYFTDRGTLSEIGGLSFLVSLVERTVSSVNVDRYAALIADKYVRRKLVYAANEIGERASDTSTDLEAILAESEIKIAEVGEKVGGGDTLFSIQDVCSEIYINLDKLHPVYPTSLRSLRELIVGYEPGCVDVIAARTSMGKTHFAVYESFMSAFLYKVPVIYFSLEMSRDQIGERIFSLCSHNQLIKSRYQEAELLSLTSSSFKIHRSNLYLNGEWSISGKHLSTLSSIAFDLLEGVPFTIWDNPELSVSQFVSACKAMKEKWRKSPLVVIDYLSMMKDESLDRKRWSAFERSSELKDIVYRLSNIAKQMEIALILVCQLNREVESHADKRPNLSHLRECGAIEERVDRVFFLYRDEYYNKDSPDAGKAEIIVAKNRRGSTGMAMVGFSPEFGHYYNLAPEQTSD